MAQLGADVDALDELSRRFTGSADQIGELISGLAAQIQSAWWVGGDADKFRGDWDGQYKPQLQSVCDRLRETAQAVTQQATQQRQTSQA